MRATLDTKQLLYNLNIVGNNARMPLQVCLFIFVCLKFKKVYKEMQCCV